MRHSVFFKVSDDVNPIHLNPKYAKETAFKGCIAHEILITSFNSTVIGTRMPGQGCNYLAQNLKFKAPVRAGDLIKAV